MPKGAYPGEPEPAGTAGNEGSLNAVAPRTVDRWKFVSYTSTFPERKFVASRKFPVEFCRRVSPLYTAPVAGLGIFELSTVRTVEAAPVQPEIVPSSVTYIKLLAWPPASKFTFGGGATTPVGVAGFELPAGGAITKEPIDAPV